MDDDRVVALDLGGTWMRAAVVEDGCIVDRRRRPTPHDVVCHEALGSLIDGLDRCEPTQVVVGVAGIVDYRAGHVLVSHNLPPGWASALDETSLSGEGGRATTLVNDADLAALGEAKYGAGRGFRDVVYVTISTGIGAGVVLDGRPCRSGLTLANVGSMVLDGASRTEPRTLEDLASGTAIGRQGSAAGIAGGVPAVLDEVRAGDVTAARIWENATRAIAVAVVNLVHLFSPEVVVIGGGVSQAGELLLEPIRRSLHAHDPERSIDVRGAECGDDAGLLGSHAWCQAMR